MPLKLKTTKKMKAIRIASSGKVSVPASVIQGAIAKNPIASANALPMAQREYELKMTRCFGEQECRFLVHAEYPVWRDEPMPDKSMMVIDMLRMTLTTASGYNQSRTRQLLNRGANITLTQRELKELTEQGDKFTEYILAYNMVVRNGLAMAIAVCLSYTGVEGTIQLLEAAHEKEL